MRFTANWFLSVSSERKKLFMKFCLHKRSGYLLQTTRPTQTVSETKVLAQQQFFLILMPWYHRKKVLTKTEMIWASLKGL